MVKKSGTGKIC